MIKMLLSSFVISFIILYMAFAFVNWDIAWGSARGYDCEMVFYLAFCGILSSVFIGLF